MTAIAGFVDENKKVWIGGDSAGVGYLNLQIRSDPKVLGMAKWSSGIQPPFAWGNYSNIAFRPPTPFEGENGMGYMVKRFIPEVKTTLKDNGFQSVHDGREEGGEFLVGYRGDLYSVESDYQVGRVAQNYHACGCGSDLVLGAFFALRESKLSPEKRVREALKAAAEFSAGVSGPFHVLST